MSKSVSLYNHWMYQILVIREHIIIAERQKKYIESILPCAEK